MVDPARNWIKLHRNLLLNELWRSEPFSKGQAWVDLLMLANHTDGYFFNRGIQIDVLRGQVGMSELQLSIRWKWSRTKVKKFAEMLEKLQQIKQHRNAVNNLITIVNYDVYQEKEQEKEQHKCNRSAIEVQQKSTNKKDKEVKEVKEVKKEKIKPLVHPEALRLSGLLAEKILINYPEYRELNNGKKDISIARWAQDVEKLERIDNRDYKIIEATIVWCQQDDFWKDNILSGATLREKWDKLQVKMKAINRAKGDRDDWERKFLAGD